MNNKLYSTKVNMDSFVRQLFSLKKVPLFFYDSCWKMGGIVEKSYGNLCLNLSLPITSL